MTIRTRLRNELLALYWTVAESPGNSFGERLTLVVILGVWVTLELGGVFFGADHPVGMWWIRALALYTIGRYHGVNVERVGVTGVDLSNDLADDETHSDDTERP